MLAALLLGGFVGWVMFHLNKSYPLDSTPVKARIVTLTSKQTGEPLADTEIQLSTTNGTKCGAAACPNNAKLWRGRTDAQGRCKVNDTYIQQQNEIGRKKVYATGTVIYEPIVHFDQKGVGSAEDPVDITLDK